MKGILLMKISARAIAVASIAVACCLGGCKSNEKAESAGAMSVMNTKCPYSGGPVNADVCSEFNGQKVGFCCAGCKGKFDKATDAEKAKLAAKAK